MAYPVQESIIEPFKKGNIKAFTAIYDAYYLPIFYFARRFVPVEDAEEITADAFCKVWERRQHFAHLTQIKVFLQISVRNACLNHLRSMKYRFEQLSEISPALSSEELQQFDREEIKASLLQLIHKAIVQLPKNCRLVMEMAYLRGLKNEEIASELKVSLNTVKTQKQRGLKVLRLSLPLQFYLQMILIASHIFSS